MSITPNGHTRSACFAKDRMKALLISERVNCSPQMINMLRSDVIHSVRKYMTIKEEALELTVSQEPAILRISVPVLSTKDG